MKPGDELLIGVNPADMSPEARAAAAKHVYRGLLIKRKLRVSCEMRLIDFIAAFWHIVEPEREFVRGWAIDGLCEHLESVTAGEITRLLLNVPPGFLKSLATSVFWPAWEWGPRGMSSMRYLTASYSQALTVRDNGKFLRIIKSDEYRSFWPNFDIVKDNVIKPENDKTGWKLASSVSGLGTGERGDRVILDDPNNVKEAESKIVRDDTNKYFTEVLPSRLNDQQLSAIIVIQQRTHEQDVSGMALDPDRGMNYTHFMVPMEYDSGRHCSTVLAYDSDGFPTKTWSDPRTEDGDLAFPERFPRWVVDREKMTMGEYACTPAESPVLMRDLSLRPISEVAVGDEVVGFTTETAAREEKDEKYRRRNLVGATVRAIHKYVAPVVKMTLDSGHVIRCTANHQWYSNRANDPCGNGEQRRPTYRPAKVGTKLVRICDPSLPILTREQERMAGYVAGFFDGDGSVSLPKRRESERPSCIISFYQGCDKNLPVCGALEAALIGLGLPFDIYGRAPQSEGWQPTRQYRLTGRRLPLVQKFLHVIQPTKWRQRLIDYAIGTDFIAGTEKVLSIEPDGEETVYALETTTGNYVVWGLASSNSAAQFQQLPAPRGGGIFKRINWRDWPPEDHPERDTHGRIDFPGFEYVIASLDTAFTEKQENDPSALTIWGIWRQTGTKVLAPTLVVDNNVLVRLDDDQRSKIMLIYGWKKRVKLHGPPEEMPAGMSEHEWKSPRVLRERQKNWGLVEWVAHACINFRIDRLLIENKANGADVAGELQRLFGNQDWGTELINPKGDKVNRAISVEHLFSNGLVYAPMIYLESEQRWAYPEWCDTIISDMAVFPKGGRDITDSATQALKYLRDRGLAVRNDEQDVIYEEMFHMKKRRAPLYPV